MGSSESTQKMPFKIARCLADGDVNWLLVTTPCVLLTWVCRTKHQVMSGTVMTIKTVIAHFFLTRSNKPIINPLGLDWGLGLARTTSKRP